MLEDNETGRTVAVLDTKYKNRRVDPSDVAQVVAYAEAKDCERGVLIYPVPLERPVRERINRIAVSSASFDLSGDLETAGRLFLEDLAGAER